RSNRARKTRSSPARKASAIARSSSGSAARIATAGSAAIASLGHAIDADQLDAEVAQPVEQAVELRLVGELGMQRRLARARYQLDAVECALVPTAEATADDDLVGLAWFEPVAHAGERPAERGELSSPGPAVHPGESPEDRASLTEG